MKYNNKYKKTVISNQIHKNWTEKGTAHSTETKSKLKNRETNLIEKENNIELSRIEIKKIEKNLQLKHEEQKRKDVDLKVREDEQKQKELRDSRRKKKRTKTIRAKS